MLIRGEFLEIPGLRLTRTQIQQLWGLRADVCSTVLEGLLGQRFLQLTADGYYVHDLFEARHPASSDEALERGLLAYRH